MTQLDALPKSNLTMGDLYSLTNDERDVYLNNYFKMRLTDYLIQTQTRFCSAQAVEQDTIEELQLRNIMFEK